MRRRTTGVPCPGVLVVFTSFPADDDAIIDEWYTREHLASRVAVDGFLRGRRYEGVDGDSGYLAVYDTTDAGVLASAAYHAVSANPDCAERAQVPKFRGTRRTICDVTETCGEGSGAFAGFVLLNPDGADKTVVREQIRDGVLPRLVGERGVIAAHLWESNAAMLARGSRGFVPETDAPIDWLIVWEATRAQELASAGAAHLDTAFLEGAGARPQPGGGHYRLLMSLDHAAAIVKD